MANQHTPYAPAEVEYLRAHYATATKEQILANLPTRIWENIVNKAARIDCNGRARYMPPRDTGTWGPENMAILLAHYPTGGATAVAGLTGATIDAVRAAAWRHGIAYVAQGPKPRAPRAYRPRAKKADAPKPTRAPRVAKPAPVPAVKRTAGTPLLDAAKAARKHAEKADVEALKAAGRITVAELKRLHPNPNCQARLEYNRNGQAGYAAWHQQQPRP